MKYFLFQITMKKVPFDSDKDSLRFDQKYVLHNQDEKISLMQFDELRKVCQNWFYEKKVRQKAILENFYKFYSLSQIVIFNLSSCDSSPPLEPVTGESSNAHKMCYNHPNLIPSVDMGSRRRE